MRRARYQILTLSVSPRLCYREPGSAPPDLAGLDSRFTRSCFPHSRRDSLPIKSRHDRTPYILDQTKATAVFQEVTHSRKPLPINPLAGFGLGLPFRKARRSRSLLLSLLCSRLYPRVARMGLLHKLRRRKRDKNAEASAAAASLLLPALPFNDDDKLAELEDKGTQTSNDSGYGSAENASPTFATTPAELSASEDQEHSSSEDLKFAQLVNLEQDVVNRRRRESIRFELFGTDDDDDGDEEGEAQEGASIQSGARPPPRPRLNICTSVAGRRPPTAITPVSADSPQLQAYRPPPTWCVV